ncbi:unnamed protein product [Ceutorhynchus assimilis]|uniref:PDZ domain-containing protein n=1 Tax=Ceutorhynchus assimilis TaxID=467358 RepID=A0A9N9MGP3_9CUCU|nr:unnamed protein product [Ceutorhynchus assimilis]
MCSKALFNDFSEIDLNGSISQQWKKIRNCCSSLRGHNSETSKSALLDSTSPHILVSTPHATSSLRLPSGTKKSSVQDVLRAKFNQIHVGLKRRRALSVQEFFHNASKDQTNQPKTAFYVPPPENLTSLNGKSRSFQSASERKPRSRQRASLNLSSPNPTYYYEPPPDYDVEPARYRRWSVATNPLYPNSGNSGQPQPIYNHPMAACNIENFSIKIPKTKINKQQNNHLDRARSQSPSWNKKQSDCVKAQKSSKVVNSRSHYELGGGVKIHERPESSNFRRHHQDSIEELEEIEEEESKFCTLPRGGNSFTIKQVLFKKGHNFKPLGFSIVGGKDSPKGSLGIYVKTVFPNGQAAENGTLKEGDEILAVNNKPLHGTSHKEAINVFKQIKSGDVLLHIGRRANRRQREKLGN